jgi:predicted NAD/FAD-binding protein
MKKVAVIGTGIAGLSVAWLLRDAYDVTVYEKNEYVGGHTNTRPATVHGRTEYADTGFMVFNHVTYPNLVALFNLLQVPTVKTDMSFGIRVDQPFFEVCTDAIFTQKKNIFQPAFWRMLWDVVKFNRYAESVAASHEAEFPLKELLDQLKMHAEFRKHYLLPMISAIWSTKAEHVLEYPARNCITFFKNHGLLQPRGFLSFLFNRSQ